MNREPRYPEQSTDVFRISNSSVETYLKCGLRYQLERSLGYRRTTVPMAIGTAVAAAARGDNIRKVLRQPRLSLAELVIRSVHEYDEEVRMSDLQETKNAISHGRDDAASASRCYGEQVSPDIDNVLWAERRIVAEVDDGIELAGTPDCVTTTAVRDTKTGQPWTEERARNSRQLTGYSLLHEAARSKPPDRVAIDSIYQPAKGKWAAKTIWSHRTEEDRLSFIEVLRQAKKGIEAGVALPAPEGAWWCGAKWCQFYGNGCPIHKGQTNQ